MPSHPPDCECKKEKKKNGKVPRSVLVAEIERLQNRNNDTMRKLNEYSRMLHDLMKVAAVFHSLTDARMREVLSWPST